MSKQWKGGESKDLKFFGPQVLPVKQVGFATPADMTVDNCWSQAAVNFIKKRLTTASAVYFQQSLEDNEMVFGELIFENQDGKRFELSRCLVEHRLAKVVPPEMFLNMFNRSVASILDRWEDNARSRTAGITLDSVVVNKIGEELTNQVLNPIFLTKLGEKEETEDEIVKSIEKVQLWKLKNESLIGVEEAEQEVEAEQGVEAEEVDADKEVAAALKKRLPISIKEMLNKLKSVGGSGSPRFSTRNSTQTKEPSLSTTEELAESQQQEPPVIPATDEVEAAVELGNSVEQADEAMEDDFFFKVMDSINK